MDEAEFSKFHSSVKRGDIVGIRGFPGLLCYISQLTCYAVNTFTKEKKD